MKSKPCQTAAATETPVHWHEFFRSAKDRLVLIPRSPKSILLYWEWTTAKTSLFKKGTLAPDLLIKIMDADTKKPVCEVKLHWDTLKTYIEPPVKGKYYYAVAYISNSSGRIQTLLESNTVLVPGGTPLDKDSIPSSQIKGINDER